MAKTKKQSSDLLRRKQKTSEVKKHNPFEVKINKQKHKILNRKIPKHDEGAPGRARSRGIQKRKDTLLPEIMRRGKAGGILDRRFGENDPTISIEDKMLQRFAIERQKRSKGSMFQLDDSEDLGHSLAEIEMFKKPVASDDDDEGEISAEIVSKQHFGGGLLQQPETGKRSWQQRLEDVIKESKQHKYERQREKEDVEATIEKVDMEWKELGLLLRGNKRHKEDDMETPKKDPYDIAVGELQFDQKATATDRIKSEEELAKEEKERLEKLEADRIRRMKGVNPKDATYKSADDLDTDYYLSSKKSAKRKRKEQEVEKEKEDDDDEENESDEDGDDDDDDDEDDNNEDEGSGDEDKDGDSSDDDDDVESEEEEDGEEEEEKSTANLSKKPAEVEDEEDADTDVPYVFKAPATYEELENLLSSRDTETQLTILSRLRACHHPSLAEGNKDKLGVLFTLLLQYQNVILAQQPPNLQLANALAPHFYALCQVNRFAAAHAVLDEVKSIKKSYEDRAERRGGKGVFPGLSTLLFFKLIRILFPTSDLKHSVVTPAMLLMGTFLTRSTLATGRDVAAGLLLCSIFIEYTSESQRYVPEVVQFLTRISNNRKLLPTTATSKEGATLNILKIFNPSQAVNYLVSDEFRETAASVRDRLLKKMPQKIHSSHKMTKKPVKAFGKLLEPQIIEGFDPTRKKGGSDKQRLTKKLKKESKGAMREIRKDMQFVHSTKLKQQLEKDKIRKQKVTRILADLASQEGDVRNLKRLKNKT